MNDDLSRLLDGELDPLAAAELQARIATDPVLAARWARMQALPGRLASLPTARPVPTHLQERATRPEPDLRPPPVQMDRFARSPLRKALPWLGWAVAAGALFSAARPEPTRVLVEGTELVSGDAEVLAGDVRVEVDGVARVSVEPASAGRRGVGAEDLPVDRTHLLAALAGSVVTVTVIEGVALLTPPEAAPVKIEAGESHTVGPTDDGEGVTRDRVSRRRTSDRRPDPEVAQLRADLDRAKMERAVAVGQLRRVEGEVQPWPADVPAAYRPEAFERFVTDRAATIPNAEVLVVDCEEFPCLAVLQSHGEGDGWEKALAAVHQDLPKEMGDASVMALGSESMSDVGTARLYAVGIAPGEIDADRRKRLKARADAAMEDLAAEITGEE